MVFSMDNIPSDMSPDNSRLRPAATFGGTSTPREAPRYETGTGWIVTVSVVLIILNALSTVSAVQAVLGADGTEYSGFFLGPLIFILLLFVLSSLLSTSLRRTPLPPDVRRKRLLFSVAGCASTFLPPLIGFFLR